MLGCEGCGGEHPDIGERRGIRQGDPAGLAAAHGQAGHRAVLRVGDYAVLFLHHRDDIGQQDHGEGVRCVPTAGILPLRGRRQGIFLHKVDILALAVIHHDDERNGLSFGNQVVQDLAGVALGRPALLILGIAVLEIQDGILLARVLVVLGGQIDIAVAHALGGL